MPATPYQQLEQEWRRLHAFRGALALLRWDTAVMMPRGSADVRGEQLAALESEQHALLTTPRIARLLERAQANAQGLDEWQLANLSQMRRQRDHAIATPVTLISRLARAISQAEVQWAQARRQDDFARFAPYLEEVLHLVRDKAALLGQALSLSPYDALADEFTPGVGTAQIDAVFKALSRRLPAMIRQALASQPQYQPLPAGGRFAHGKQRQLAVDIMRAIGFPFDRGRIDESEHPFTEGVPGDIRITTRFDLADPFPGLLAVLHETGHAMYDTGLPQGWRDQPVGRDCGMALEESQALMLEMIVGRSRAFTQYLQPLLQKHFAVDGPQWQAQNLYRYLTHVRRSAIRVHADELTYPLHIMVRYELEQRLLTGTLAVRDLPDAWNALMQQRLELTPASNAEGCLQDIHWALGAFGYFPSYALGAAVAAQLWESLHAYIPELEQQLARGEFAALFEWLRTHVHGLGARLPTPELIRRATGQPLGAAALLRYLDTKYCTGGA